MAAVLPGIEEFWLKQMAEVNINTDKGGEPSDEKDDGSSSGNVISLRCVLPRKKPLITPPSTPKEERPVAPWASV